MSGTLGTVLYLQNLVTSRSGRYFNDALTFIIGHCNTRKPGMSSLYIPCRRREHV